jgi:hypothetical protein
LESFLINNKSKPLIILIFLLQLNNPLAQNFKFIAMSDSRGKYDGVNDSVLSKIVNHIVENQKDSKFVFFIGDMVDGSRTNPQRTKKELLHWKDVMGPIYHDSNMIWPYIWPTVGNHEVQNPADENTFREVFKDVFSNGPDDEKGLTYSFDYDNVHFVLIDSDRWYYGDLKDSADDRRDWKYIKNLNWLENDLKNATERGVKHIFVLTHEPIFPIGGHLHDGLPNLGLNFTGELDSTRTWYLNQRQKYIDLLLKYKVAAHICGHEHIYGRESVNGLWQIVAGSCGAPLYTFNPTYSEHPDSLEPGDQMTYNQAEPYYKILNYNYGPGKNSQASENFIGLRAFQYIVLDIKNDKILVSTYGAFPKQGSRTEMTGEIKLIDEFVIYDGLKSSN